MAEQIDREGVPTSTDVMDTITPEPEDLYGYRNLFREDTEAPNRDGDSVEYPGLDTNFEGDMVELKDGDPHPEAKLIYDGVRAGWTDYGFKFPLTYNDIQDSKIGLVMVNQREATREQMRKLDALAGAVAEANRAAVEVGDTEADLDFDAMVRGEAELIDSGRDPRMIVLSPLGWARLSSDEEFTSNTDQFATELRTEGIQIGEYLGYPVVRVNRGPLAGTEAAYFIDTGRYGWESPRREFNVDREEDRDKRQYDYFVDGRIDWVSTDPGALVKVVGGGNTTNGA